MSRESELHVELVRSVIRAIEADFKHVYSLVLYADLPNFGRDRPHPISGYIPDVLALDIPETFQVLGEAKTHKDLETDRSQRQIRAFLRHLAASPSASFYLAVPLFLQARAKVLMAHWAREVNATSVRCVVASTSS